MFFSSFKFNITQLGHICMLLPDWRIMLGEMEVIADFIFVFQLHGTPTTVGSSWTA